MQEPSHCDLIQSVLCCIGKPPTRLRNVHAKQSSKRVVEKEAANGEASANAEASAKADAMADAERKVRDARERQALSANTLSKLPADTHPTDRMEARRQANLQARAAARETGERLSPAAKGLLLSEAAGTADGASSVDLGQLEMDQCVCSTFEPRYTPCLQG